MSVNGNQFIKAACHSHKAVCQQEPEKVMEFVSFIILFILFIFMVVFGIIRGIIYFLCMGFILFMVLCLIAVLGTKDKDGDGA